MCGSELGSSRSHDRQVSGDCWCKSRADPTRSLFDPSAHRFLPWTTTATTAECRHQLGKINLLPTPHASQAGLSSMRLSRAGGNSLQGLASPVTSRGSARTDSRGIDHGSCLDYTGDLTPVFICRLLRQAPGVSQNQTVSWARGAAICRPQNCALLPRVLPRPPLQRGFSTSEPFNRVSFWDES